MPDAGSDVIIGLSSPGDGASFTSITYSVYFRGSDSGKNGDLMVYSGADESAIQDDAPGNTAHLLGSGEDWFDGTWASATWYFRVTSATSVDLFADDRHLYSWTGSVAFPLKVSTYNYNGGCARGIMWL